MMKPPEYPDRSLQFADSPIPPEADDETFDDALPPAELFLPDDGELTAWDENLSSLFSGMIPLEQWLLDQEPPVYEGDTQEAPIERDTQAGPGFEYTVLLLRADEIAAIAAKAQVERVKYCLLGHDSEIDPKDFFVLRSSFKMVVGQLKMALGNDLVSGYFIKTILDFDEFEIRKKLSEFMEDLFDDTLDSQLQEESKARTTALTIEARKYALFFLAYCQDFFYAFSEVRNTKLPRIPDVGFDVFDFAFDDADDDDDNLE